MFKKAGWALLDLLVFPTILVLFVLFGLLVGQIAPDIGGAEVVYCTGTHGFQEPC